MGVINVDDLKPGMVLAQDLRTAQGRLLLAKGGEVTEQHLRVCRIWGITEADICAKSSCERNGEQALEPDLLKLLQTLADWHFSGNEKNFPPVRELTRLFIARHAQDLDRDNARELVDRLRGPKPPEAPIKAIAPPDWDAVLSRELELASLPTVFNEIVEAVKSPKNSATHVAEVIGKDPSLASRLLRLVNSAFFGFSGRVDTLPRAVAIVGTIQITNLAMGIAVTTVFGDIPSECLDMRSFWQHSISVGVLARLIASHARSQSEERLFVAGLLHDIGRLMVFRNFPELAGRTCSLALQGEESFDRLERRDWGISHAELGSRLMAAWKLPDVLQQTVRHHHTPFKAEAPPEAAMVHVADVVAHALALGHSGSRRVPPLDRAAWNSLGLPASVLPTLVVQAESQMRDLMRILLEDHARAA